MHPTDGVDLMPYLSGEKAPLKDRTWLCALEASPEKMSGIEEFSESGLDADLVHLAYVRDDRKLLCWIPQRRHCARCHLCAAAQGGWDGGSGRSASRADTESRRHSDRGARGECFTTRWWN